MKYNYCEQFAEALREANEYVNENDMSKLAAFWCSNLIPHPPIYYLPKEQARQLCSSLGINIEAVDRKKVKE